MNSGSVSKMKVGDGNPPVDPHCRAAGRQNADVEFDRGFLVFTACFGRTGVARLSAASDVDGPNPSGGYAVVVAIGLCGVPDIDSACACGHWRETSGHIDQGVAGKWLIGAFRRQPRPCSYLPCRFRGARL